MRARRGVVLIWALITMAVTTTILGAMGAYYVSVGRMANVYMGQTSSRFGAQNALEATAMTPISEVLQKINAGQEEITSGSALKEKIQEALKNAGFTAESGKNTYTKDNVQVTSLNNLDAIGANGGKAVIEIYATYSRSGSGSIKVRQTVTFEAESSGETIVKSHPIFNYVYFANNRGHLESKGIVANGDVGANDKLTIAGATINGYVTACRTQTGLPDSQVVLLQQHQGQSPRMWPYKSYLYQVAEAYTVDSKDYYTPVRPTDPYKAGGVETSWSGGYQYPPGEGGGGKTITIELEGNMLIREFWAKCPGELTYGDWDGWYTRNTKWENYKKQIAAWIATAPSGITWKSKIPGTEDCTVESYKRGKKTYYTYYYTYYGNATSTSCDKFQCETYYKALEKWYADNKYAAGENQSYIVATHVDLDFTTYAELSDGTKKPIINVSTNVMDMPNLSDTALYRGFCASNIVVVTNITGGTTGKQEGGTLVCRNRSTSKTSSGGYQQIVCRHAYQDYVDERGKTFDRFYGTTRETGYKSPMKRNLASINIVRGYNANVMPFEDASATDEAIFKYKSLASVERGSVILVGTAADPITINGPVYFDGDVIIRGFVTGQGSIYAGRNIHILGDLVYLNPPSWPHSESGLAARTPNQIAQNNAKRDLLMLAARGNIVIGDYTQADWQQSFTAWVTSGGDDSTTTKCNEINDLEIGYPANLSGFSHKYADLEGYNSKRQKVGFGRSDTKYYEDWSQWLYYYRHFPEIPKVTTGELHYYETVLGDAVISGLSQSKSADSSTGDYSFLSGSVVLQWLWRFLFGESYESYLSGKESLVDYSDIAESVSADGDAGDITRIDAVLFANHGIFGKVGGSESKKFTLNGAMICRDDGLLPAFRDREGAAQMWLNWDMRIASDSAEGNSFVGASPESSLSSSSTLKFEMYVSDWQQVQ